MKQQVLRELKLNRGKFISGEDLSKVLGVSRTSIWKYIKEFKKEGYDIESSSKRGYMLVSVPDIISANEISYNLETAVLGKRIFYFDSIDSTNTYAKMLGNENCEEGTIVVADMQTHGRGRLGRQWSSTSGKGIWMSIILKPDVEPEAAQIITIAAAVAVVNSVKKITGIQTGIKWPNDIILNGKKVCGILTEMNSEMERVNFIVLGIGINVNQSREDFPDEIKELATSLKLNQEDGSFDSNMSSSAVVISRSEIIKSLLYELERIYSKINKNSIPEIIEEWKKYSITLGREVRITSKSVDFTGIATNITNEGKLVVTCSNGDIREVVSGEVSVRGVLGAL